MLSTTKLPRVRGVSSGGESGEKTVRISIGGVRRCVSGWARGCVDRVC